MIRIEEDELLLVSRLLTEINPSSQQTVSRIRAMIMGVFGKEDASVLSTGGWMASAYKAHNGDTVVRVSLTAYAVARYLNGGASAYGAGAKFNNVPGEVTT